MADWDVIELVTEYETGWYTGGYDLVEQPDGSTKRYYWAELPPAVVVVAIRRGAGPDGANHVVFVEQYRPTVRDSHRELPAGIVEDGEDWATAGARELQEETGYAAEHVEYLIDYAVATGVLRHQRGIVVAEGLEAVSTDRDANEFLSLVEVPAGEALDAALEPPRNDATIDALLLAEREGMLE